MIEQDERIYDSVEFLVGENGGGTREYEGTMGEGISTEIEVYTLDPECEAADTSEDTGGVDEQPEQDGQRNQEKQKKAAGTGPNLRQINNLSEE